MTHEIKLREEFCEAVYTGQKSFEIRFNDRGYQKGDEVIFKPVSSKGITIYHPVSRNVYEITYVISGWGLQENYVAFGINKVNELRNGE